MEKSRKRQRKAWNAFQESVLLHLWEENINALRSCRKNSHIFVKMAAEMKVLGHDFSATEIKIKIHNLTNKYRTEKNKIGPSGVSKSEWGLFAKVHQILGGHKTNKIKELTEERKTKRTSSSTYHTKITDILEANSECLKDEFEHSREFENKILILEEKMLETLTKTAETLQTMAENNRQFQEEVLEILRNRI